MTAPVVPLRPADDIGAAAHEALGVVSRHLDRCKLSARTVRAYKRQAAAYAGWLAATFRRTWSAPLHGRQLPAGSLIVAGAIARNAPGTTGKVSLRAAHAAPASAP